MYAKKDATRPFFIFPAHIGDGVSNEREVSGLWHGLVTGSGIEVSEDGKEADGGGGLGFHGLGDPGFVVVVFALDGALIGFLLLAFLIVGGGEALGDGFHEIEFELGGAGIEEGAELGELAGEFRLGVLAELIAGFGKMDGKALDGFREELLDGGEVEGLGGIRVVVGETGS
jgi:hypothetical protein